MTSARARDRKPHEPTAKELKEQAEGDAWRAKYPSVYAERQTKVSRTWDWFASGRLSLGLYSIDRRDNYREFCKSFACHSSQDVLAFAQIVTVLMRSSRYRHYTLGDLEWLVIPPLVTRQYTVANTSLKQNGVTVPVAIALWASVSAEVDKRLSENLHLPIRLRPDEWQSGDVLWLIDAVGDPRVVPQLLKQLVETTFKGRELKVRVTGEDGKVIVQRIAQIASAGGLTQKH